MSEDQMEKLQMLYKRIVDKYFCDSKNHDLACSLNPTYVELWEAHDEKQREKFEFAQKASSVGRGVDTFRKAIFYANPIGMVYGLGKKAVTMGKLSPKEKMIEELQSEDFTSALKILVELVNESKLKASEN